MVTDSRPGKVNSHSTVPPIDAGDGRQARWRVDLEVRVDDGAELGRRLQVGDERCRSPGRHREHHGVVFTDPHLCAAEVQRGDAVAFKRESAKLPFERDRAACFW